MGDPTAIFTLVLALVASGQAGLFVWQLIYMRAGLRDAKSAADAARLSAEAAIALELPRLSIISISLKHAEGLGDDLEARLRYGRIDVTVRNGGKTQAFLRQQNVEGTIDKRPVGNEIFTGNAVDLPPGTVIAAGADYIFSDYALPRRFDDSVIKDIVGERTQYIVFGYLAFTDFLDSPSLFEFVTRLQFPNLLLPEPKPPPHFWIIDARTTRYDKSENG